MPREDHSSKPAASGKSQPTERHAPQFRGTFAPADLWHLLHESKITPTELVLLQLIDSLVNSRGEGCWASNAYLGTCIGRHPTHISKMIAKLTRMKLLIRCEPKVTKNDSVRVLETAWSRIKITIADEGDGLRTSAKGATHRCVGGATHRCVAIEENRGIGEGEERSASPRTPPKSSLKESKGRQDEECRLGASHLRQALRKNNKPPRGNTADKWEDAFRLLRDQDKEKNWMKVLRWYCKQIPRFKELGLPRIADGKEFRARFDWIKDIYDREVGEDSPTPKGDAPSYCIYGNTRS